MRFENTDDLRDAEFVNVDLSGAHFQNVNLTGVDAREAMLVNARFSGLIDGLVVNDVEVAPLIDAELNRRYPERTKLRPRDAAGVREAWGVIEQLWNASKERAASLPEPMLHERVDGEWSFLETMRHLIHVTDLWISERALDRERFHRFGVAPTFVLDVTRYGLDADADPTFAEVVPVREERMGVVADLIAAVTDEELRRPCDDVTLHRCLLVVFDEEWHHNWYANRDLDSLTSG